ncbi:MAG: hypothetical protein ACI4R9_08395 [Kiritimatiellia bacterium]
MKSFLTVFVLILAGSLWAEKQPLSRYQSIIDRRPFGQPPPGYDPDATVLDATAAASAATAEELTQEQEQLQRAVSFTVMNINNDGSVSVGFSDLSDPKTPKHYYLRDGEAREGWRVKSVDVHEQSVMLEKDGVEITRRLGDSAKADAKGDSRNGRTGANGRGGPVARSGLLGARKAHGGGEPNAPASYASRRQRREQEAAALEKQRAELEAERKRQAEEQAAKAAEEKAAREEERAATRQHLLAIQEELRKARDEAMRQREQQADNEDDES